MLFFGKKRPLDKLDFVILASQRTGSNMLVSQLDAYPGVRCHGELFRKKGVAKMGALKILNDLPDEYEDGDFRDASFAEYLRLVRNLSETETFFGFKLMLNQAREARQAIIRKSKIKIILLYRENLLSIYSSNLIAKSTGQGIARSGSKVKSEMVEFDETRFVRFCEKHRQNYQEVREDLEKYASGRFLDISYLEICKPQGITEIEAFLGLSSPPQPVAPATAKRNSSRIIDRFTNPQVVVDYLERTGNSPWAEESFQ